MSSHFDLFSAPVSLYFHGNKFRSSNLGFFLSFALIVYLVFQFFTSDLFQKSNPNTLTQAIDIEPTEANRITFDDDHFFTVHVDIDRSIPVDPSIIGIGFFLESFHNDGQGNIIFSQTSYDLEPCTPESFPTKPNLYNELALATSFCLKNQTFILEGDQTAIDTSIASIVIAACNNATSTVICKSYDEINAFITNNMIFGGVKYFSAKIDLNNYENPIQDSYHTEEQPLDVNMGKTTLLYLQPVEVHTDDNWLFSSDKIIKSFQHSYKDMDFNTKSTNDGMILNYVLEFTASLDRNQRTYEKLPNALAGLTGMANLIMIVCFVFSNMSIHFKTLLLILNELYFFPKLQKINHKIINPYSDDQSPCRSAYEYNKNLNLGDQSPLPTEKQQKIEKNTLITGFDENLLPQTTNPLSSPFGKNETNEDFSDRKAIQIKKVQNTDNFFLENFSQDKMEERKKAPPPLENLNNPMNMMESMRAPNESALNKVTESKIMPELQRKKSIFGKIQEWRRKSFSSNVTNFFKNELKETEETPLKMGLLEYVQCKIGIIFRCKDPKYKLIKKAEKILIEELDIIRLLGKLHEIEKLKILLMNEDQLMLFDSITKPMIEIEDENNEGISEGTQTITKIMKKYKGKKDLESIMKAYKTIRDNQENNPINKRLVSLLSDRIKKAKYEEE